MKPRVASESRESVRYCRTFPGCWAGVSEWIEVIVEPYDAGWGANCSLGFPDPEETLRGQWNTWRLFTARDDAARYAADFVVTAEALIAAIERGERPFMPHRAMADACAADLDADPGLAAMAAKVEARTERRSDYENARRSAEHLWYRAHDWRDFRAPSESEKEAA